MAEAAVAFVPAQPKLLAEKVLSVLLKFERRDDIQDREHLGARLESLVADWITLGRVEDLKELVEEVLPESQPTKRAILDGGNLDAAHALALKTINLLEFAQRFASTSNLARATSFMFAAKRKRWRRGLIAMSKVSRRWSLAEFMAATHLGRSSAYDALASLAAVGMLVETGVGPGTKSYTLSPLGWGVVHRLKTQLADNLSNDSAGEPKKESTVAPVPGGVEPNPRIFEPAAAAYVTISAGFDWPRTAAAMGPLARGNFVNDKKIMKFYKKLQTALQERP
jgi:hypothetical protein